jgi:hypothetical protein
MTIAMEKLRNKQNTETKGNEVARCLMQCADYTKTRQLVNVTRTNTDNSTANKIQTAQISDSRLRRFELVLTKKYYIWGDRIYEGQGRRVKRKGRLRCWKVIKRNKKASGRINDILENRTVPRMQETDEYSMSKK